MSSCSEEQDVKSKNRATQPLVLLRLNRSSRILSCDSQLGEALVN